VFEQNGLPFYLTGVAKTRSESPKVDSLFLLVSRVPKARQQAEFRLIVAARASRTAMWRRLR